MPLEPNLIERQLIKRGVIPWLVWDGALALMKASVLVSASAAGLFDVLEDGTASRSKLADACDCSRRGMDVTVHSLIQLGYLEEEDGLLSLTKYARRALPIGEMCRIAPFMQEMMRTMADGEQGMREAPEGGIVGWETVQSGPIGEGYQAMMRYMASGIVDDVVGQIDLPDGAERMLDVGGSHGLYTVAMCRKHPGLKGTIVDWPIGLAEAKRTLEANPDVSNRIDLVERDFEQEELPQGFDFVFLGNIIHGIDETGNRGLFRKIDRSTRSGAVVGIVDQFAGVKGSKFARGAASLIGFNLFLFSGGRSYEFDVLADWLADAGFRDAAHHDIKKSPGFSLLLARKD